MEGQVHNSLEGRLLRLFEAVRREPGLSVGLDGYVDLLRAVNAGFLCGDMGELRRLCVMLWGKSREEGVLVGRVFDWVLGSAAFKEQSSELDEESLRTDVLREPVSDYRFSASAPPSVDMTAGGGDKGEVNRLPADISTPSRPEGVGTAVDMTKELHGFQRDAPVGVEGQRRFLLRRVPVGDRQRAQAWRKLRQLARVGARTDVDLEGTLDKVAESGHFFEVSLQKSLENVTELHFLVDRDGSMVPFHGLCRSLLRGARTLGQQHRLEVRYFHDWPEEQVFREEVLLDPEDLEGWMRGLDVKRSLVVILSDAGAARGNVDRHRIRETVGFLERLGGHCKRVAWLNPMPVGRWKHTSAGEIARFVPMFEVHPGESGHSGSGIYRAVDYLRGKTRSLQLGSELIGPQPPSV